VEAVKAAAVKAVGGGLTKQEQDYLSINTRGAISDAGEGQYVPEWFMDRNNLTAVHSATGKETEKAVQVRATFTNVAYGSDPEGKAWVPKSILQTRKEYAAEGAAKTARWQGNQSYTKYLKDTAKAAGVKIGNMSSWDKIQAKLKKAGVKYKTRDAY
jgi:hypothetical protein